MTATFDPALDWPRAYGGASGSGDIKTVPDDFVVEEMLGFEPEGSGEHVFLLIEKIGENTEYIARLLARHAGVRQRDIGFAGMKDRHGRTKQWFSIWLPGKEQPNWQQLASDSLIILQTTRHARKLKRGVLAGNRFDILIRDWQGNREQTERQLEAIRRHGFPNYFAEQRFGHQGQNLQRALALFAGAKVKREQRSIYLSAARSFLFNELLAQRVAAQNWRQAIRGDVLQLDGSHSVFTVESIDQTIADRLANGDVHVTGPLFGNGKLMSRELAFALEQAIADQYPQIVAGLKQFEIEADRRSLRAIPLDLEWFFPQTDQLRLRFSLPAGSYATALLRELIDSSRSVAL